MTTPTTPYALFEHVPLSECRGLWRSYGKPQRRRLPAYLRRWRGHMAERYVERLTAQLAAVTAERDALRRDNARLQLQCDNFPEWMNQKNRIINEMSGAVQQLRAERDELQRVNHALRRELADLTGEL